MYLSCASAELLYIFQKCVIVFCDPAEWLWSVFTACIYRILSVLYVSQKGAVLFFWCLRVRWKLWSELWFGRLCSLFLEGNSDWQFQKSNVCNITGKIRASTKKNSGNFVLKTRVFCASTPWLRPSEKAGVLNIDFCSKISKNSWQEVAAHSGLIVTKACSHSGETVISKTHEHFLWQKLIVSCVCELECFVCSGLWNKWVWKCTQGLH